MGEEADKVEAFKPQNELLASKLAHGVSFQFDVYLFLFLTLSFSAPSAFRMAQKCKVSRDALQNASDKLSDKYSKGFVDGFEVFLG